MTALEIRKELRNSIENGTIFTTIYNTYVKYLKEKVNPVPCVLAEMHNNCEIDLNKVYLNIINTESKRDFFSLFLVYSKTLPMLNSSVSNIIPCVHHLLEQAGNDLIVGELYTAFVSYCKENIDRPEETFNFILNHTKEEYYYLISSAIAASDKNEMSEWVATKVALLINHESVELQRQGYLAIGRIPFIAKQNIDVFYSLIEKYLDEKLEKRLQAGALRAVVTLGKVDAATLCRAESLLKKILRFSEPELFYEASHLVAYEKKELPQEIFILLIKYLKNAPCEYPNIVDNIDFSLVNLLKDGNNILAEELLSSLLHKHEDFKITAFKYFSHEVSKKHQGFINLIVTKWFVSGSGHLCRALHDLFSIPSYEKIKLCACLEYIDNFDFQILFTARKAVGWLFLFPIPATTFILSMYNHATLEIKNELKILLFEHLLLNYSSTVRELLNSYEDKKEYKELINSLLIKYEEYYKGIESACKIKELQSTSENNAFHMKYFNKSMQKAFDENQGFVFRQLFTKQYLLYGDSSIHYISNNIGDKDRSEIQMGTISHSMEFPILPIVDYVGHDYQLRGFRHERWKK